MEAGSGPTYQASPFLTKDELKYDLQAINFLPFLSDKSELVTESNSQIKAEVVTAEALLSNIFGYLALPETSPDTTIRRTDLHSLMKCLMTNIKHGVKDEKIIHELATDVILP